MDTYEEGMPKLVSDSLLSADYSDSTDLGFLPIRVLRKIHGWPSSRDGLPSTLSISVH